MYIKNYFLAIKHAATLAPGLEKPTDFLKWAEDTCDLLSYIFDMPYDDVTQDLVEAAKESQDYEDE